ncbi:heparan-alpha-glucosaminide N-acetyltransferase domain-containing protein [Lacisediminihabitans profunda]|uniref:heparan-alpha-glucosaminide N-acetyltransferase domain-containing protein n=1 Tax=Lacisediminihabitans profunda TaxID=2594790 RepID=UPI0016509D3D|nr:heparan-alpha-glucosaminide N-acetyltransferase domain-containing protein [Lacisediminihabitans profunda]
MAQESTRDLAIDRLRGALVILMVGGNYLGGVQIVPAYLKHAPDIGFTVADMVAAAFVFLIGVNYGPSFARQLRQGAVASYRHFLVRYVALFGIGAILAVGATNVAGIATDWGVLEAIGVAGLVCLALIRLPAWARFVIGFLMLCGYQYLLDSSMLAAVLHSVHGGPVGALSWAALLVLSTAVADVWRKRRGPFAICCAALVVAAAISVLIVPVSKNRVSLSYVLVTLAISTLIFTAVELGSRVTSNRAGFFCWWGENPLVLYLLHLLLLAIVVLPGVEWWYAGATVGLVALQLVVILTIMSVIAWGMHRRRFRIRL